MFEYSGSWFGTFGLFFHILGLIIPTDFYIFQRGRYTTNQDLFLFHPQLKESIDNIFDNMDMGQNPSTPFCSLRCIAEISGCSSPL